MDKSGHLVNLFCADRGNVGDWYSSPLRYFPFFHRNGADIRNVAKLSLPRNVIVGGGGLISPFFSKYLELLVKSKSSIECMAAWGVGSNVHYRPEEGFEGSIDSFLPEYLEEFDLIGVRDIGTRFRWVPCASCMHQAFLGKQEVTQTIVVYDHKDHPINIDGLPRISNSERDISKVLRFLGSAEAVVTNSYHGVYWSTLLGKRVAAIPFSTRFHAFKHPPALCTDQSWERGIEDATNYPAALSECRKANLAFFCDLASALEFNL